MSRIRLVTDSTADIPAALREEWGIEMVPLKVHFGSETFTDGVTILPQEFYEKLVRSPSLPTTSQPSPVDFLDTYKKLMADDPDTQIISIHLSSALSGTYQSAVLAKSMLEGKSDIAIIDSKSASYGFGLMVMKAAEAARQGKSKEEVLAVIEAVRRSEALYFMVDTLEYLQKGGRIGKASAFIGSLLNIKPILTIDDDGEVASVDKVRGQKKAMARTLELLAEKIPAGSEVEAILFHCNSLGTAEELNALVQLQYRVKSTLYTALGAVIGTHAGPGTIAALLLPV